MTKLMLAVVALVLATAAPAEAHTLIACEPCSEPYQRWVDAAKVPSPNFTLTVVENAAYCETARDGAGACTLEGTNTIWFDPAAADKSDFLHEVGHNFSYAMPNWARERFLGLTHDLRAWRSPPNSPNEQFAEAYALCAEQPVITVRPELGYEWNPSPRLHRRVCHLIQTAGLYM